MEPIQRLYKKGNLITRSLHIDEDLYKKVSNGMILDNIYNSEYVLFYYLDKLICVYKEYEKSKIKPFVMI